jgi:hypothetical protein
VAGLEFVVSRFRQCKYPKEKAKKQMKKLLEN